MIEESNKTAHKVVLVYKPFERLDKFQIIAQGIFFVLGVIAWRLFEANVLSILLFNSLALWSLAMPTQGQRRMWTLVSILKSIAVLFLFGIAPSQLFQGGLLAGNVDQFMYLRDGIKLANLVAQDGLFFDYFQNFSLHNRSYHYLVGLTFYILNSNEAFWIIIIHLHVLSAAAVLAQSIVSRMGFRSNVVGWVVLLMPFLNIYALYLLRDLTMALLVTGAVWTVVSKKYFSMSIVLFILLYTRLQLGLLLGLMVAILLVSQILLKLHAWKAGLAFISLGVTLALFTTLLNPWAAGFVQAQKPEWFYIWPSLSFEVLASMLRRLPLILSNTEFVFASNYVFDHNYSVKHGVVLRLLCPELLFLFPLFFGIVIRRLCALSLFQVKKSQSIVMLSCGITIAIYIYGYLLTFDVINARHFIPWIPLVASLLIVAFFEGGHIKNAHG